MEGPEKLQKRGEFALERQAEHERVALGHIHIQLAPDAEFTGQINARLDGKTGSGHQPSGVLRLETVDIGSVAMDLLADRVTGTVDEPVAVAGSLDHAPTSRIDFIPEWAMARLNLRTHKIESGIATLPDQIKNLPVSRGHLSSDIGSPGDVCIDGANFLLFCPEVD